MRILYLTDSRHGRDAWHDPSARHRCFHYADALSAAGVSARVASLDDVGRRSLNGFDHVVFHRPKFTRRFVKVFRWSSDTGAQLHADYDDLIFNPDFADQSPLYLNGNRPLRKVCDYFEQNHQAAACFDRAIISTRYLARQFQSLWPERRVTVLPNSLPRLFRAPGVGRADDQPFTLGYFPGSNSHKHDMAMISDVLQEFFHQHPSSRLLIAGRMNGDGLSGLAQHATFLPYADYNSYLTVLSRVDLSIAPLEHNVFNQAKSAVKLIESVAVGTPILSSANPDMDDHENELSSIVESNDGWRQALSQAMLQRDTDPRVSSALAERFSVRSRLPVLTGHFQCAG